MNKKAIGLVLVGVIAGSSITAFAAGGRKIEVFDNVKKVVVNKINKPFTKGEEPFTYNGRTYVPLRYVSEALGENVDWDGKTGTVYIGDRYSTAVRYWDKDIKDMSSTREVTYAHNTERTLKSNTNEEFSNYLDLRIGSYSGASEALAEFPLNGQYKKFTAKLALPYYARNYPNNLVVSIYLDDKRVYEHTMTQGSMPKDISIDLTGANKIKFELKIPNSLIQYDRAVMFGNGQFIKK